MNNNILYEIDNFYIGKLSFSCKSSNHSNLENFFNRIQFFDKAINYIYPPQSQDGKIYTEFYTLFLKQKLCSTL